MHSTQVRKKSAILIVGLAGLLLGSVPVSADVTSNLKKIPSADDCGQPVGYLTPTSVYDKFYDYLRAYDTRDTEYSNRKVGYTLDQFVADLNGLLTKPEIINCRDVSYGMTIAHVLADLDALSNDAHIVAAKWMISKGIDLSLVNNNDETAAEYVRKKYKIALNRSDKNTYSVLKKVEAIFNPAPVHATKTCAEVDGQTPPANEYCIIAENVQSSRRIAITGMEKQFAGGSDYKYEAHRDLSGTGLFPGWKAVITFTCSLRAESDCGYADYVLPSDLTPEQVALLKPVFEVRYGLNVHCGESADLLDLDRDLEPGESVSVTHASDTKRSFPWHMDCRANALDPFTLTVKTTRLAQ